MAENQYSNIERLLASTRPDDIRQGLLLAKKEISKVSPSEAGTWFEMISTIFYIDTLDHPELVPILDEAINLIVGFGKWIIPVLVRQLEGGDVKAQMAAAQALGRIGEEAIEPLIAEYKSSTDFARRTFILYALGKIKSANVAAAASLALDAARSPDHELRDTATRAIGKFAESIPPSRMPAEIASGFIEVLKKNLSDSSAGIRAKAIRSLGKLAKFGHLKQEEKEKLRATCLAILGKDKDFEWDRAYVVRKQAEETLVYVGGE